MDSAGPSALSQVAALIYVLVACLCLLAARGTRGRFWIVAAGVFAVSIIAREAMIEEWLRIGLRSAMAGSGWFESRRTIQLPLAALVVTAAVAATALFYRQRANGPRLPRPEVVARIALGLFFVLIALRIISYHGTDWLLYGPLRLNWVVDLGCSIAIGSAALASARSTRKGALPDNPSRE